MANVFSFSGSTPVVTVATQRYWSIDGAGCRYKGGRRRGVVGPE